jgi:hypothetical protein
MANRPVKRDAWSDFRPDLEREGIDFSMDDIQTVEELRASPARSEDVKALTLLFTRLVRRMRERLKKDMITAVEETMGNAK